ncbi:MAG: hypothetical protein VXY83_02445 [Pseudomonadota bacterium]|nr:hypothetical protein [Pseudomonadota bacterium]
MKSFLKQVDSLNLESRCLPASAFFVLFAESAVARLYSYGKIA